MFQQLQGVCMRARYMPDISISLSRVMFGLVRAAIGSLLMAALGVTQLHAQTVGYTIGFNSITVTSIPSNTTVATIPAGIPQNLILAAQIIAAPNGARVYALYEGSVGFPSSILVIDAVTNTPITTITNVGGAPLGLAI